MSSDKPVTCDVDFAALAAKFDPNQLEWRIIECGKGKDGPWAIVAPYVTARAIMDRLDDVVGAGRWQTSFTPIPGGGAIGTISIKIDGEWVSKSDGADNTDIEPTKGGISTAMKRAAVHWEIGRYLYALPTLYAGISPQGTFFCKGKKDKGVDSFKWDPPLLPEWALPKAQQDERRKLVENAGKDQPQSNGSKPNGKKPSERPGVDVSPYTKALAAIQNAPTPARVEALIKAAIGRSDEFTADEIKKLEQAAVGRKEQLSQPV